jgi:hypothetical protein
MSARPDTPALRPVDGAAAGTMVLLCAIWGLGQIAI